MFNLLGTARDVVRKLYQKLYCYLRIIQDAVAYFDANFFLENP